MASRTGTRTYKSTTWRPEQKRGRMRVPQKYHMAPEQVDLAPLNDANR